MRGKREREICRILGPTEWFQPRHLQSPEVCKEEEVAVTSKSRSAHKLGWNGQRGIKFKPVGGSKSPYEGVVFVPSTPGSKLQKELQKREDKFTKVQKIKGVKFVCMCM